jgi:hypothetical protein
MDVKDDKKVFAYCHPGGCWVVSFEWHNTGYIAYLVDGYNRDRISMALTVEDVDNTMYKLKMIPGGRIRDVDFFLMCVSGAIQLSRKWGR